mmetsp:Transcript_7029/g.21327  ORF Transcript_7029/g.21327 Transcript_7029/m.21327 type:complete len:245 (-) Transcript_7029:833-1567(-)
MRLRPGADGDHGGLRARARGAGLPVAKLARPGGAHEGSARWSGQGHGQRPRRTAPRPPDRGSGRLPGHAQDRGPQPDDCARGLPLVRRLGSRHHDLPARPHADDRPPRRREVLPGGLRELCERGHGPQPPRRQRRVAGPLQHRRRLPLVPPRGGRLCGGIGGDPGGRLPAAAGLEADHRRVRAGHALRHPGGPRGRARLRRQRRDPAHVDGRAAGRRRLHAPLRKVRRDQRALAQRARGNCGPP